MQGLEDSGADQPPEATLRMGGVMLTGTAVHLYVRAMHHMYRPATITARRYWLERFAYQAGNPALKAIRPRTISDWFAQQPGLGPAAARAALSHLRAFFRWAIERGHTKTDPTLTIRPPKQPRAVPRSLDLADLRALRTALPDNRAVLIITLLFDLGLRRGEVARLDMADIDLRAGVIRVDGKGGHQRLLPVTPGVRHMLLHYLTERGAAAGPLIRSQTRPGHGITPETLGKLVSKWMTDAGIKQPRDGKSAHALRHSCAENLWRHGVDLRTIAAALGHAVPTTTWIYLRHQQNLEELRAVMGQQYVDEPRPVLQPAAEFEMPHVLNGTA